MGPDGGGGFRAMMIGSLPAAATRPSMLAFAWRRLVALPPVCRLLTHGASDSWRTRGLRMRDNRGSTPSIAGGGVGVGGSGGAVDAIAVGDAVIGRRRLLAARCSRRVRPPLSPVQSARGGRCGPPAWALLTVAMAECRSIGGGGHVLACGGEQRSAEAEQAGSAMTGDWLGRLSPGPGWRGAVRKTG